MNALKPEEVLRMALRAVENAECAAQLEIQDRELRRSLVRNIVAMFAPGQPLPQEEALDGGRFAEDES